MDNNLEPQVFTHGVKLRRIAERDNALAGALRDYEVWRQASLDVQDRNKAGIEALTGLLNDYKSKTERLFDSRANSAQELLQPSILEEFLEYLFSYVGRDFALELVRRPAKGYLDLVFNPRDAHNLASKPDFTIRRKAHDFVIGASVNLTLRVQNATDSQSEEIIVPAVALECKRYLERNMLDECAGTAEKIKRVTPFCLYVVLAEFLKMDDATPELSRIDEIYILRKQKNSERLAEEFVPNPIDAALVEDLYVYCLRHLRRVWWDPNAAVTIGKVFNFPG